MPNEILVPFDGSALSRTALKYACSEFDSERVTALYVIDKASDETAAIGWGDHPGEWEDWLEDRKEHARELFSDAQAIVDEYGVSIQTGVAVGHVAEMIVRSATEYDADLIVIGVHNQSRLEELVNEDVARTLIRTAPVPVTTIREDISV